MRQPLHLRQPIGAAAEPVGELREAGALLTPAEDPTLERPKSPVSDMASTSWQAGEVENPADVLGAAPEPARQLRLVDTLLRQAQQAPLEWAQVLCFNSHAHDASGHHRHCQSTHREQVPAEPDPGGEQRPAQGTAPHESIEQLTEGQ